MKSRIVDTYPTLRRGLARTRQLTARPFLLYLDRGEDAPYSITTMIVHNKTHPEPTPVRNLSKSSRRRKRPAQ
ncbi:hypothetical protein [uncultured Thiodictyon sp.]|uniref:hypothetical protein n=1 Tax=uncultured Thiodictyon sp. TaxID=1846217 RepID=UPI0025DDDBC2|nr:hypothetical protein [uncultured Thiodictyon sp.]